VNKDGRGPAWANSLFEDNAEFGLGMRLSVDKHQEFALELMHRLAAQLGDELITGIATADQTSEAGIKAQRERVELLKQKLAGLKEPEARMLNDLADYLVNKSVWIVGGDGWAYDIGYGGLDHVLASGRNVNVLVLDTEVYSNTGGQASKSTPMGASAKFAMAGKSMPKKDLAMLAMTYGHPYVARVAIGAKDAQTVNAFKEADSYSGVSVIVAYAHCIAHGYDLANSLQQQERAVDSAYWPLFRYDPRRVAAGESPLKLDSPAPKIDLAQFVAGETRFKTVEVSNPEGYKKMMTQAQKDIREKFALYEQLAKAMNPANLVPGGKP
ncbi:MAG: thiamine pyrophosphate-dependent enzyme, partial [Anaeromyxobacteraceae bacterium]